MTKPLRILELFGGIGAPRKAFNNLDILTKHEYVEKDKRIVKLYNEIYNENFGTQDVTVFKTHKNFDYLIAGFPCQPFSQAGKRLGFEDPRGKLYKDTLRIIKETEPKNVILENVKGILRKENYWIIKEIQKELEEMNYSVLVKVISSSDYGFKQKRERVFIIAIKNINKELVWNDFYFKNMKNKNSYDKKFTPKDFKESDEISFKNVDELSNFWVIPRSSDGKLINGSYNRIWKINKQLGTIASSNTPKIGIYSKKYNKLFYRKLTALESFLFMGFDKSDYKKVKHNSENTLFHATGNSMVVGVMEMIILFMEISK